MSPLSMMKHLLKKGLEVGREFSCAILHRLGPVREGDQVRRDVDKGTQEMAEEESQTVVELRSCNFLLIINNFHII